MFKLNFCYDHKDLLQSVSFTRHTTFVVYEWFNVVFTPVTLSRLLLSTYCISSRHIPDLVSLSGGSQLFPNSARSLGVHPCVCLHVHVCTYIYQSVIAPCCVIIAVFSSWVIVASLWCQGKGNLDNRNKDNSSDPSAYTVIQAYYRTRWW